MAGRRARVFESSCLSEPLRVTNSVIYVFLRTRVRLTVSVGAHLAIMVFVVVTRTHTFFRIVCDLAPQELANAS